MDVVKPFELLEPPEGTVTTAQVEKPDANV